MRQPTTSTATDAAASLPPESADRTDDAPPSNTKAQAIKALPLWLQLSLLPLLIGLLVTLVVGAGYYFFTKDGYLERTEQELLTVATLVAGDIDRLLNERVRVVKTLARDARLVAALRTDPNGLTALAEPTRQQRITELNDAWRRARSTPRAAAEWSADDLPAVLADRLVNSTATFLRAHAAMASEAYGEIFLTDRFGALVASTGPLTTLAHRHKYWWQGAYAGGRGRTYLDDRGFDDSVGDIVLGLVVPVRDGDEILGMLKANVLIRDLVQLVPATAPDLQLALIRSGGRVLLEQGPTPLSTSVSAAEIALMSRRAPVSTAIASSTQAMVLAFAPIPLTLSDPALVFGGAPRSDDADHRFGNAGEHWSLMARRFIHVEDVLGISLGRSALLASAALLVAMPLSGWIGWRLARPINRIARRLDRYTPGSDLPRDTQIQRIRAPREVQRLDAAFYAMAERIAEQSASIDNLSTEVVWRRRAKAEQQKLLAELERSNRELAQFASIASHDLQEPLRMVTSYLQLIERRYTDKLDDEAREFMGFAVDGAQRMRQLIQDLLLFSRVTTRAAPFDNIDTNVVLDDVLHDLGTLIDEHKAQVQSEPLPALRADPTQLRQLLQNLIGNAIKFHHPERLPLVQIAARRVADAEVPGQLLVISDNGIGIPENGFERIFDVFQRLHTRDAYPGTGIGLAVCKKIAERHGGFIRVASEPGKGSRFEVFLPDQPDTSGAVADA